jgi:hypothetical protein
MTNATLEASTSAVGSPPVYVLAVPQSFSSERLVAAEARVALYEQALESLSSAVQVVIDARALSERPDDSDTRILTAGAIAMMDHAAAAGSVREDFSAFLDDDD